MSLRNNSVKKPAKQAKDAQRPLASKRKQSSKQKKLYDQIIFRDWCKACGICSAFCPKKVIKRDDSGAPLIQYPDDCTGCRFCELHCPDFAVTIKERRDGSEKKRS